MEPICVHHVSINVSDVERATAFYVDRLGFGVRSDRPDFGFPGAWLDAGAQQLHLIQGEVPARLGQHFAVQVADLDAVVSELRSAGIEVGDPSPVGHSRQAFVDDPDGNTVELHEVGG